MAFDCFFPFENLNFFKSAYGKIWPVLFFGNRQPRFLVVEWGGGGGNFPIKERGFILEPTMSSEELHSIYENPFFRCTVKNVILRLQKFNLPFFSKLIIPL